MKKILLTFILIFSISFSYYNCKGTLKEDRDYLILNLDVAQFFKEEGMNDYNIEYLQKSMDSYKLSQDILNHIKENHKNELLITDTYTEISSIEETINNSIKDLENTLKKFKKN